MDPTNPKSLDYATPPPPASRAGFIAFLASFVALLTSFLVVPPILTLIFTLTIRNRLRKSNDSIGLKYAAAAFATSVFGSMVALVFAARYLGSGRIY